MDARAFFAVELADDVRGALSDCRQSLGSAGADAKWVAQENLHVTMHFLGHIEDRRIPEACRLGERAAGEVQPFEIAVRGLSLVPPTGRNLRMIWASVDDLTGRLVDLHGKLGRLLADGGFEVDPRPFRPHVTLARFRSSRSADEIRDAAGYFSNTEYGRSYIRTLVLFSSELSKSGPLYIPLATAKLGGGR